MDINDVISPVAPSIVKPLITVLTHSSSDYWELNSITAPTKLAYCLRYQYQFVMRYCHWCVRTESMADALRQCDWLWFTGADVMIMNHCVDVAQHIDNNYCMVAVKDWNDLNNDSFLLRNCERSIAFLREVGQRNHLYSDQDAMVELIREGFPCKFIDKRLINSYPCDYQHGDLALHLVNTPMPERLRLARKYAQEIIR
jgi:hypothetical protein